ncbi:uncharacterized protein LOC142786682 [Rhipicephalus microplus]|uniref:uncharacterized protein LOC142786682 n=1 Tax=Rhipicephalus microplus TaxID=6941 RepID=UPI003F6B9AB1
MAADPGLGMGMDGMDDYDDMPIMAGASRPWLSTTAILVLLSVFLISLVGIILFSLYLYFLQAKLECPSCKVVDVATLKKKKLTTTTTSTESILRQVEVPEDDEPTGRLRTRRRQRRRPLRQRNRRRRRLSRIWRSLRPYYQARLYASLWRLLDAEMREQRLRLLRTSHLRRDNRRPKRLQGQCLQGQKLRLRWSRTQWQRRRRRKRSSGQRNTAFACSRRLRAVSGSQYFSIRTKDSS